MSVVILALAFSLYRYTGVARQELHRTLLICHKRDNGSIEPVKTGNNTNQISQQSHLYLSAQFRIGRLVYASFCGNTRTQPPRKHKVR